ncbi:transcriptional regulator [Paramagnetospirillum kuznetsovii]|uniref:Transcriptional regulator n=1 Tax=Paramagnetospirillum kuznetsovii TaxID=2053833 RepID=A0A364NYP9_9PROT|nr:transcriptional regulator [Paramagnetospirillum kuznetsovii]RAU22199.1 transcriptional regulator [Paramagnetospirillum kuznetsovii]
MPLTRDFKNTIKARAERDPEFRKALVEEASECLLDNDLDSAKAILRDYINATMGFEGLAEAVGTPSKSLMRMFGPRGNPQAKSILPVIAYIRRREHLGTTDPV